jgi:hypothetical protein
LHNFFKHVTTQLVTVSEAGVTPVEIRRFKLGIDIEHSVNTVILQSISLIP